jgi:hypothetical protein
VGNQQKLVQIVHTVLTPGGGSWRPELKEGVMYLARTSQQKSHSLNEAVAPVEANLFGEIVHAEPAEAIEIAQKLPLDNRARLAAFCYARRHMNHLGLLIASTCDRMALRRAFGPAGDVVFKQSRDVEKTISAERRDRDEAKKITLANSANVVSLHSPVVDLDPDDDADNGAASAS